MGKNLPTSKWDMGSIPGQGRAQSHQAAKPGGHNHQDHKLLLLKPVAPEPALPTREATAEKPAHRGGGAPPCPNGSKPARSRGPAQPELSQYTFKLLNIF